jgi:hypothetical protein
MAEECRTRVPYEIFLTANLFRICIFWYKITFKSSPQQFVVTPPPSSFLIQVSCMVYTIKKLEFKKLEWRLGCKTYIVYTGLYTYWYFWIFTYNFMYEQRWKVQKQIELN